MLNYEDEKEGPRTSGPLIQGVRSTGIKVQVEKHVMDKMMGWCKAANSECSGKFMVRKNETGFYVYDVFLPEQQCSSGYTVFKEEAYDRLTQYVTDRVLAGRQLDETTIAEVTVAIRDLRRGWWHTHYNFNTFWSGTDDNTATRQAFLSEESWGVSIVVNQSGDALCRVDILSPCHICVENVPIEVVPNTSKHRKRNYKWDVKRWVSPLPRVTYKKSFVPRVVIMPKTSEDAPTGRFEAFNGKVLTSKVVDLLRAGWLDENCPCKDHTCEDCKYIINGV
jgi:hypothetical protein